MSRDVPTHVLLHQGTIIARDGKPVRIRRLSLTPAKGVPGPDGRLAIRSGGRPGWVLVERHADGTPVVEWWENRHCWRGRSAHTHEELAAHERAEADARKPPAPPALGGPWPHLAADGSCWTIGAVWNGLHAGEASVDWRAVPTDRPDDRSPFVLTTRFAHCAVVDRRAVLMPDDLDRALAMARAALDARIVSDAAVRRDGRLTALRVAAEEVERRLRGTATNGMGDAFDHARAEAAASTLRAAEGAAAADLGALRAALAELVATKDMRDAGGKTAAYEERRTAAWRGARMALGLPVDG